MRRARLIPLVICALTVRPAAAQWQLTADGGTSRLRQAGIPESNALTLGATLDGVGERSVLRSSVLAALAGQERWTGQALVIGSIVGPTANAARWELDGVISSFGQTSEMPTSSAELAARARIGTLLRGGAIGGGLGGSAHGGDWNPLARAQADGWWSVNSERFIANVALTRTRSVFGDSSTLVTASHARSYYDLGGSWRHERDGISLGANFGLRGETASGRRWTSSQSVHVAAWLTPRAALVVSAGSTLEDVVRGVPRTRFVSATLRVSTQPHTTIHRRPALTGAHVVVERTQEGRHRIHVRANGASRVEMMADFTDWSPVSLERAGDRWRLERSISSGLHRIAIRIDDGAWIVPVNLPRVEDDLAGAVGLITIP